MIDGVDRVEPWRAYAACRGLDPELFYSDRGESTEEAKAVCARCDVREECLEFALENFEKFGVWGGYAERTRRQIRKQRRAARRRRAA